MAPLPLLGQCRIWGVHIAHHCAHLLILRGQLLPPLALHLRDRLLSSARGAEPALDLQVQEQKTAVAGGGKQPNCESSTASDKADGTGAQLSSARERRRGVCASRAWLSLAFSRAAQAPTLSAPPTTGRRTASARRSSSSRGCSRAVRARDAPVPFRNDLSHSPSQLKPGRLQRSEAGWPSVLVVCRFHSWRRSDTCSLSSSPFVRTPACRMCDHPGELWLQAS
eukprot:5119840-Pleurochrysis_carterae.AAC.2